MAVSTPFASSLASIDVPTPSEVVRRKWGPHRWLKQRPLLAAGEQAHLIQPKQIFHPAPGEQGAVTVAIAEAANPLRLRGANCIWWAVGQVICPCSAETPKQALSRCVRLGWLWPLPRSSGAPAPPRSGAIRWTAHPGMGPLCRSAGLAQQGAKVALVSSGDSGIYGMAGLALELWMDLPESDRPQFQVHPGLSALQLAAARAGAPLMHDFCCISLSDRLTPWAVIERRLHAAAAGDFVVALYNPRSKGRDWQLGHAIEILLKHRPPQHPW